MYGICIPHIFFSFLEHRINTLCFQCFLVLINHSESILTKSDSHLSKFCTGQVEARTRLSLHFPLRNLACLAAPINPMLRHTLAVPFEKASVISPVDGQDIFHVTNATKYSLSSLHSGAREADMSKRV